MTSDAAQNKEGSLKWLVLLTVIIGTFLGRLDQTIVNLALPKIIGDFNITVSSAGWIATAYILANAVFVPIWGKLGDTIGRKKVYLIGFCIFIIASAFAWFAWNLSSMIFFRVIQAVAGSADYPTAMAILAVTFPAGRSRSQALGIWSASFAAAAVFGPLVGGPLIDNFGWRSVFLINIPVGIIGALMAIAFVRESVSEKKTIHFDWWGAITLGVFLSTLVLVLDKGMDWGWLSIESLLSYFVIVVFLGIFIWIEHREKDPIMDLKFFRNVVFVNALANNFIVFMGMMGSVFLVPVFAQTFLGYNATETGYLFMPMAFALMIAAPLGGRLMWRIKANVVIVGSTAVAGVGIYLFSFLDARSSAINIIISFIIMAAGMGFGMAQRTGIIASSVPENEIGVASSVLALVRNIAGAFGIAIFGTLLNTTIENNVLALGYHSTLGVKTLQNFQEMTALIILKAQVMGYDSVFRFAAYIIFFGAILAIGMRVTNEKKPTKEMMMAE